MMNKIGKFWTDHKDTIKNSIILVAVPIAVLGLIGVKGLNEFIEEKGLKEDYYKDDSEGEA